MITTDLGRAAAFTGIAIVVATDQMTLVILYVSVFAVGILETLFDTASMSLTPALVDRDQLERANARIGGAQVAANEFVCPPIGAALFAVAAAAPFGVNAATFALGVVILLNVSGSYRPEQTKRPSIMGDIGAGFGFLWREPIIRAFAIGAGVINLGFTAAAAVLVLHAQDNLSLSEIGFGLLLASAAVGGVTGALLAPRTISRFGRRPSVLAAVLAAAAGIVMMGAADNLWTAVAGFAIFGFAGEVWNIVSVTYRQSVTPDDLLGRVMSGFRVIAYGAFPLGAILGGFIASTISLRAAFYIGGGIIASLLFYLFPVTSRHSLNPAS